MKKLARGGLALILILICSAITARAVNPSISSTAKANTVVLQTLPSAAYADTILGTGFDLIGYNTALIAVNVGDWTDGTHTFKLEESSVRADTLFTTVASGDIAGTVPTVSSESNDDQAYLFGYTGSKRYLRLACYVAGGTTGAVYGATIIKMNPLYRQ